MKKLMVLLVALSISQMASAVTLKKLAGSYKVTHPEIPVVNIVKISATGDVLLTETSEDGEIECSGKGEIFEDIFSSSLKCTDGEEFIQKIDLNGVKNLKKFKAKVYSSLFGIEIEMDFKKL